MAVVERFELSAGTKKSGCCGEVAVSGGSTVSRIFTYYCSMTVQVKNISSVSFFLMIVQFYPN